MNRHSPFARVLHWATAVLVLWQFGIVSSYKLLGSSPLLDRIAALGPSHGVVGFIVLLLAVLRLARHPGSEHSVARLVHAALRLLLVAIPALALLRAHGSGKGWTQGGVTIVPETGVEIAWMVALGNMAHGELAWALIFLIGIHILGAVLHGVRRDGASRRMV